MHPRRLPALPCLAMVACVLWAGPSTGASATVMNSPPRLSTGLASPGAQLWARRYNGTGNNDDNATALGVSPDGYRVFVTGTSVGSNSSSDYATVAYQASSGDQLWVRRYNGPSGLFDHATALGVSPDGSKVFVTGYSQGASADFDYATVAYDASNGTPLWSKRYDGTGSALDIPFALGVSTSGSTVFVTGQSDGGAATNYDYATVAYDATTGARRWVRRYDGPGSGHDYGTALGVSPDGSKLFVTGFSYGGAEAAEDYATVAYNASSGDQLWVTRYADPAKSTDEATTLGVSPDGSRVFVTGFSYRPATSYDFATLAYDAATGDQLWVKRYKGGANDVDQATDLAVSPDGSTVFVTGRSEASTSHNDWATVAYSAAAGAQLWVHRYNGPGNGDDYPEALGVSPNGSTVFVKGSSNASPDRFDYATVAYSAATGAKLWVRIYHDTTNEFTGAGDLGVAPDGSAVFVTGTSGNDYATVAYSVT